MFGALCVFVKTKTENVSDPYKNIQKSRLAGKIHLTEGPV